MFDIECRPEVKLSDELFITGKTGKSITIAELFSNNQQFVIISKRENESASWKQYLTPLDVSGGSDYSIIELLKNYMTQYSFSDEKKAVGEQLLRKGNAALKLAESYARDSAGTNGMMTPKEYLQQYFLKWMLKYIPTVALFMSEDGNIRVNVIHGKIFPFVFVNDSYKRMTLERILEDWRKYGIQRFSIPAWQQLEYLKCKDVPYTHYFVKRGYAAKEAYGKVIFPFGNEELKEIFMRIDSANSKYNRQNLARLFEVLNIRKYIISLLNNCEDRLHGIIDNILKDSYESNEANEYMVLYEKFQNEWKEGKLSSLKVIDNVRDTYREFLIYNLKTVSIGKKTFSLEDFVKSAKNWENIYGYILLKTLGEVYKENVPDMFESMQEEGIDIVSAWRYIITGEYMNCASEVARYGQGYFQMIFEEKNVTVLRRERILRYIEKHATNKIEGDNIRNCWKHYEQEILENFVQIEMEEVRNLEKKLPEYSKIKREYEEYLEQQEREKQVNGE